MTTAEFVSKAFHTKAIDEGRRTADFVASTGTIDAHDEIVDQSTWQLGDYLKNPVVLYSHESDDLPIGRCVDLAVRGGQLECKIEFATAEMNPLAEQVWLMVQQKFLRAVSVGFLPVTGRMEMRDGADVWVWSDCILKEISVTPVPANPDALAKMKAAFGHDTKIPPARPGLTPDPATEETAMDVKELQDKIEKQTAAFAKLEVEHKAGSDRLLKTEAECRALEGKVKALETEKTALDAQTKSLAEARDREKARADALEEKSVQQEVDALVGKKITPAEKEMFVELRKTNKALFEKMIAQRADLALTENVLATKTENDSRTLADNDLDAEATAEIEKLANG